MHFSVLTHPIHFLDAYTLYKSTFPSLTEYWLTELTDGLTDLLTQQSGCQVVENLKYKLRIYRSLRPSWSSFFPIIKLLLKQLILIDWITVMAEAGLLFGPNVCWMNYRYTLWREGTGCSSNIVFFSENPRKFATSPSPALGCYWLYKKFPANRSDCTLALPWEL